MLQCDILTLCAHWCGESESWLKRNGHICSMTSKLWALTHGKFSTSIKVINQMYMCRPGMGLDKCTSLQSQQEAVLMAHNTLDFYAIIITWQWDMYFILTMNAHMHPSEMWQHPLLLVITEVTFMMVSKQVVSRQVSTHMLFLLHQVRAHWQGWPVCSTHDQVVLHE